MSHFITDFEKVKQELATAGAELAQANRRSREARKLKKEVQERYESLLHYGIEFGVLDENGEPIPENRELDSANLVHDSHETYSHYDG